MQIKATSTTLSNVSGGQNFSVNVTPQTFQLLSKSLYKDPLQAMIRELACNGVDSHIQAGKANEPILITLPSIGDGSLRIKDNGVGLSEEQMFSIYTQFFNSTKTNDNTQMGGFGLGSKTPFAYTNSFKIESRYDGNKTTYLASLQDGIPTLNKMFSTPTEECNGVEIIIPIHKNDYLTVVNLCTGSMFKFFEVTPLNASTNKPITERYEYLDMLLTHGWCPAPRQRKYAWIAGVLYPLEEGDTNNSNNQLSSLIIKFDVGVLSITPSRDSLSFDDTTKEAITKALLVTKAKLTEHIKSYADTYENKPLFEVFRSVVNWVYNLGITYNASRLVYDIAFEERFEQLLGKERLHQFMSYECKMYKRSNASLSSESVRWILLNDGMEKLALINGGTSQHKMIMREANLQALLLLKPETKPTIVDSFVKVFGLQPISIKELKEKYQVGKVASTTRPRDKIVLTGAGNYFIPGTEAPNTVLMVDGTTDRWVSYFTKHIYPVEFPDCASIRPQIAYIRKNQINKANALGLKFWDNDSIREHYQAHIGNLVTEFKALDLTKQLFVIKNVIQRHSRGGIIGEEYLPKGIDWNVFEIIQRHPSIFIDIVAKDNNISYNSATYIEELSKFFVFQTNLTEVKEVLAETIANVITTHKLLERLPMLEYMLEEVMHYTTHEDIRNKFIKATQSLKPLNEV